MNFYQRLSTDVVLQSHICRQRVRSHLLHIYGSEYFHMTVLSNMKSSCPLFIVPLKGELSLGLGCTAVSYLHMYFMIRRQTNLYIFILYLCSRLSGGKNILSVNQNETMKCMITIQLHTFSNDNVR